MPATTYAERLNGGAVRPPARTRRQAARDHLIRFLAADPANMAWLHEHNAKVLDTEADRIADRGHPVLAAMLRERAEVHRRHEVSPW